MCVWAHLVIFQGEVEDEAPEGGEVDVELAVRGGVGDEEDDNEHHGVGVGDHEPVGNVLGKHLDQRVGLHRLGGLGRHRGQGWGGAVRVSVKG